MISLWTIFKRQVQREARIQIRQWPNILNSTVFFLMVTVMFPLTVPADNHTLSLFAPGVIWIALLLSMLLSSERLFAKDLDEGTLEYWLSTKLPLTVIVYAKLLVHWVLIIVPLLLFSPLIGILFSLNAYPVIVLVITFIVGSPVILCLASMAAAFSLQLSQKSVLMALVLLPLTLPVIILGAGALSQALSADPVFSTILILTALSLMAVSILPFVIAFVIREGQI